MKRGFVLHHNGPPATCIGRPHTRCEAFWAAVKAYHQAKWPNSNDIAYSFGICPHGVRFVGRGWDKNQYAGGTDVVGSDDGPDSAWYSILTFVGGDDSTHDTEVPTQEMVDACGDLITEGRSSGRCGNRVLPHSAFKPKPCPGPQFTLYARLWDNQPITQEDDMPLTAEDLKNVKAAVLAAEEEIWATPGTAPRKAVHEILQRVDDPADPFGQAFKKAVIAAVPVGAISVAVAAELGGSADATVIEAVFRRVLAEAALKVDGHFELAQT